MWDLVVLRMLPSACSAISSSRLKLSSHQTLVPHPLPSLWRCFYDLNNSRALMLGAPQNICPSVSGSLSVISSRCQNLILFQDWIIFHDVDGPHFAPPPILPRIFGLLWILLYKLGCTDVPLKTCKNCLLIQILLLFCRCKRSTFPHLF